MDECSARRRDLYLTIHNTHNRQTSMSPGGILTHNPSRRAAADPRLRSRGHWDRIPYQYQCGKVKEITEVLYRCKRCVGQEVTGRRSSRAKQ